MGVVTLDQVLTFGLAAFILIVIPGPSVVFVIGRALAYGQGVALASVIGNSIGLFVVMSLVAFGLGAVVAESILVFMVLKIAGAAYLVWLGVQALRHRRGLHVEDGPVRVPLSTRAAVRQGFVVGVSNPKGFMIFAALLPQFVDAVRAGCRCRCSCSGWSPYSWGSLPTRSGPPPPAGCATGSTPRPDAGGRWAPSAGCR